MRYSSNKVGLSKICICILFSLLPRVIEEVQNYHGACSTRGTFFPSVGASENKNGIRYRWKQGNIIPDHPCEKRFWFRFLICINSVNCRCAFCMLFPRADFWASLSPINFMFKSALLSKPDKTHDGLRQMEMFLPTWIHGVAESRTPDSFRISSIGQIILLNSGLQDSG